MVLLGGAAFGITVYASGYFRSMAAAAGAAGPVVSPVPGGMVTCCWPTMPTPSWWRGGDGAVVLLPRHHRPKIPDIRRAGFLYLLIAHVGAVALLLSFGVLQAATATTTFDTMRLADMTPFWASVAYLLALFGFGAKAGLVPMHVWLPEAHPAAPSRCPR